MRPTPFLAVLIFLLATYSPSLALISVGNLTKERAEELGIELRVKAGGPKHAWIELELKPGTKLKNFQHVHLVVVDGDELAMGWTALKDEKTSSGSVIVRAMGSRAFLEKVTLRIVHGDFGGSGLDLRIKDFVDLKKLP